MLYVYISKFTTKIILFIVGQGKELSFFIFSCSPSVVFIVFVNPT